MVNYCCVQGCGRNSRNNKHLNFYGLPKERHRQAQWLKAAGRDDLLEKEPNKLTVSYRFCSRHFAPSSTRNRYLGADAIPTFYVPGSRLSGTGEEEAYAAMDHEPKPHNNVICNSCKEQIIGFRYKCTSCDDYDLCHKCESLEQHPQHFMLRIPKPMKFKFADNLLKKWRTFFKSDHIKPTTPEFLNFDSESSDDEPITKYAKNYDSGIDLSEDVKNKIRKEVSRVLKIKVSEKSKPQKKKIERKRPVAQEDKPQDNVAKRMKCENVDESKSRIEGIVATVPEVAFADVNDIIDGQILEMKPEFPVASAQAEVQVMSQREPPLTESISNDNQYLLYAGGAWSSNANPSNREAYASSSSSVVMGNNLNTQTNDREVSTTEQPVMHVKLSEDMTELMIEVTSRNQKTVYKC
ncbi:uncharacterized protein LOC113228192 [Hyposmocoma kahamanoa]|uniref:uncharacterized protein LOC113228192 n=1 Tax=Hyposmocoma kahamanoa TaxID=1477025 RepID=UPI000E6D9324|nr:uncharacterized protein LOC113228192 [Hyposmocoma kahamanoa]